MFIEGFGLSQYRSFGPELQMLGPFSQINILIGQNNSGKSNILSFLVHHYRNSLGKTQVSLNQLDRHLGENTGTMVLAFGLKQSGDAYNQIIKKHESKLNRHTRPTIDIILKSKTLSLGTDVAWFRYEAPSTNRFSLSKDIVKEIEAEGILSESAWYDLWHVLTGQGRGDIKQHWIPEVLTALSPVQLEPPKIDLIPAIRRVGDPGTNASDDYSGAGIIDRLAQLQNPSHDQQALKQRYEEINNFLRNVTGNETATLEIPYGRNMILVHMDEKTLPLSSLGTGIHEVVILAAAATILRQQAICIEEPELHLHPLLQKKFLRYLQQHTDNQYFITSHSAHFLDTLDAVIFHVRYQNGYTTIEPVHTATEKVAVCSDLGYRASDLLQANCIIWVEGPSDRIYLNHWIRSVAQEFVEGLHYSIMFYGGRLLSHLSALDPEIDDFISLRRLNRHISILIDSDRSSRAKDINETKQRISDEFNKGPGLAWITAGREIENYIEPVILEEAVKKVHPQVIGLVGKSQYADCLKYKTIDGKVKDNADKVKIAYEVTQSPANLDVLDLKDMLTKLVTFIRESNEL